MQQRSVERSIEAARRCDQCGLCCKTQTIQADNGQVISKAGEVCKYWGKVTRCRIYGTRPVDCRKWHCAWILGGLPIDLRPDKTRCVVWMAESEDRIILIAEDSPGASKGYYKNIIPKWIEAGYVVKIIRNGIVVKVMGTTSE